jgi:hypothetical protein
MSDMPVYHPNEFTSGLPVIRPELFNKGRETCLGLQIRNCSFVLSASTTTSSELLFIKAHERAARLQEIPSETNAPPLFDQEKVLSLLGDTP